MNIYLISGFPNVLRAEFGSHVSSMSLASVFLLVSLCDSPWRTLHDPCTL